MTMPSYFEENRFSALSESFRSVPSAGGAPQTHRISDRGGVVEALQPSAPQAGMRYGPAGLKLLEDEADRWHNIGRDESINALEDAGAAQLPMGERYRLLAVNPGQENENSVIYVGGDERPSQLFPSEREPHSLNGFVNPTDFEWRDFNGRKQEGSAIPSKIGYYSSQGEVKVADVVVVRRETAPTNVARPPEKTFVGREPGDVIRDGGQLPADGRLDKGYPGGRDPGSLA